MTLLIVIISQRGGDILEAVYAVQWCRGWVGGSRKVRGKEDALYSEFTKGREREASSRPWRRGNAYISGWRGPSEAMRGVACHVAGRRSLEEAAVMGRGGEGGGGRVQQRGAGVYCAHQHNTNQFGSSHTAGQQASPKCTGARTIAARHTDRQTRVSNGVYRSQGRDTYSQPVKVT